MGGCTFFVYIHIFVHKYMRSLNHIHSSPLVKVLLHLLITWGLSRKNSLGCWLQSRELNYGLLYRKPTHCQLSYAAPEWATPHLSELHRSLWGYDAPFWGTSQANSATPHPIELRRTLTQLHRSLTHLRRNLSEQSCTIADLRHTLNIIAASTGSITICSWAVKYNFCDDHFSNAPTDVDKNLFRST